MTDPQQVLSRLNFGRVDGETDTRFENCFIGTDMLRQVLTPQHSLVVGNKGSGKSAICRLLCDDLDKVKPLLPRDYEEVYCIPAYGLQSEEFLPELELSELNPKTVDEFRYFWLLYLGLKTASHLVDDERMQNLVEKKDDEKLSAAFKTLKRLLVDVGMREERGALAKLRYRMEKLHQPKSKNGSATKTDNVLSAAFKKKTGSTIIAILDNVDTILVGTNTLVWLMLDKLDLLFVDDIDRLRASIAGLVQLLVQYGNQFKNIHLKIFLRNDIYRQLHIVNKSHLVNYTTEMKWRGSLLLKVLVSRAVVDAHVRGYCEEQIGQKIDVTDVILGSDEFVEKLFYTLFEPTMGQQNNGDPRGIPTHQWILKRLIDGAGNSFPRELIHLGNRAVEKQRDIDRLVGRHASSRLISSAALKDAFETISQYRCDTYLYAEFPHLAKHFDVFRGSDTSVFHREQLYMLFEPLSPKGDEAIRAAFDVGLLAPLGTNVDSSRKFKIPLLYRKGLGITDSRPRGSRENRKQEHKPRLISMHSKMN